MKKFKILLVSALAFSGFAVRAEFGAPCEHAIYDAGKSTVTLFSSSNDVTRLGEEEHLGLWLALMRGDFTVTVWFKDYTRSPITGSIEALYPSDAGQSAKVELEHKLAPTRRTHHVDLSTIREIEFSGVSVPLTLDVTYDRTILGSEPLVRLR